MSNPKQLTKSGDVLQDEQGAYAICVGCKGRVDMSIDKPLGDMHGNCSVCGCHLDADKEGIWGVEFLGKKDEEEDNNE